MILSQPILKEDRFNARLFHGAKTQLGCSYQVRSILNVIRVQKRYCLLRKTGERIDDELAHIGPPCGRI
jgi:hypothetical protein